MASAPRAFLSDFGLARDCTTGTRLTRTGTTLGTPAYMSPELARGEFAALTPASDVWALGCVLFECAAGQPGTPDDRRYRWLAHRCGPPCGALSGAHGSPWPTGTTGRARSHESSGKLLTQRARANNVPARLGATTIGAGGGSAMRTGMRSIGWTAAACAIALLGGGHARADAGQNSNGASGSYSDTGTNSTFTVKVGACKKNSKTGATERTVTVISATHKGKPLRKHDFLPVGPDMKSKTFPCVPGMLTDVFVSMSFQCTGAQGEPIPGKTVGGVFRFIYIDGTTPQFNGATFLDEALEEMLLGDPDETNPPNARAPQGKSEDF